MGMELCNHSPAYLVSYFGIKLSTKYDSEFCIWYDLIFLVSFFDYIIEQMGNTVNCSILRQIKGQAIFKSSLPLYYLFILVTYQKLYYPQPGEGLVTTTETVSVRVIPSSV